MSLRPAVSFDCYGTIIDWETGILAALRELASGGAGEVDDVRLLELYARHEAEIEAGPYRPYREVLGLVEERVARDLGVALDGPPRRLAASLASWPPFPDSTAALRRLGERYRLAVISNVDDDLFAGTRARLEGVELACVVTAQQAGAYKPSHEPFRLALRRLGVAPAGLVHVAQSVYHDHVPARDLGLRSIRVDRPSRLPGRGLTPKTAYEPAVEVSDLAAAARLLVP